MNRGDLEAYARRDWTVLDRLDREHWVDTFQRSGGAVSFRVSAELAEYVRRLRPDWPSAADRQEDLEHHVALKRRIDRAARAFNSR